MIYLLCVNINFFFLHRDFNSLNEHTAPLYAAEPGGPLPPSWAHSDYFNILVIRLLCILHESNITNVKTKLPAEHIKITKTLKKEIKHLFK